MAIKFTLDHDHTYEGDDGEEQLVGWIHCSVTTKAGDFRSGVSGGNPKTVKLPRRSGWLAADGHLYKDATSGQPFRLVANDPEFNLDHLTYKIEFELTTLLGEPVEVPYTYFPAPSTDTTAYITRFLRDPGQTVMEVRAKLYAEDIIDLSDYGRSVLTGESPVAVGSIITVDSSVDASPGEAVFADATDGGFTVYLPTAPTDRATVWVKKTDTSSNAITVQRTGDDVFNREDGPSSLMLYTPGESVALQYDSGVWYVVNHSLTVTGLDGRYLVKDVSPTAPEVIRILDAYSNISFEMRPTANAVNMLRIYNSATGSYPTIVAGGQDATIGLNLRTTGWGGINLLDGGGGTIAAFYRMASSANVNSWEFKNSTTGEGVVAGAAGSDTNISINMKPKNAGRLQVNGVAVPTISSTDTITNKTFSTPKIDAIHDVTRGLPAAEFYAPTSAVNWTLVKGSAAGQPVALFAQGSDSDVSIQFAPKGAGEVSIYVGTGQTPTLRAVGADTNHDLKLYAKNAGVIKMGSTVGLSGGSGTATIRAGTGSPEGSVTATPGSQYFNTNGGAGATFFVKESGSGNTGWVAK